mmetsp:Transcript_20717/g.41828  ORF Transcript_20717/g.41828 Transcript_20717/m.41828 type:complete len:208 (-) Transcript_20717:19-642(-)
MMKMETPRDQISHASSCSAPRDTSGAMKPAVPHIVRNLASFCFPSLSAMSRVALKPKSHIFTLKSSNKRKFSGFKSLWRTPAAWQAPTPSSMGRSSVRTTSSGSLPTRMTRSRQSPLTAYGITKMFLLPNDFVSTLSTTSITFGCLIFLSAFCSRRKARWELWEFLKHFRASKFPWRSLPRKTRALQPTASSLVLVTPSLFFIFLVC